MFQHDEEADTSCEADGLIAQCDANHTTGNYERERKYDEYNSTYVVFLFGILLYTRDKYKTITIPKKEAYFLSVYLVNISSLCLS